MKKILFFLVAMMLATIARAADGDSFYKGLMYRIISETKHQVEVAEYGGMYDGEITIPASVTMYGTCYDVTSIGDKAFYNCLGLKSVIIPNSVTSIGDRAFWECRNLRKSAYPSGLSNPFRDGIAIKYPGKDAIIEDGIIYGPGKDVCYFAPISFEGDYSIPESVTTIGKSAFSYCRGLTSVTIPNSVTRIGNGAFEDCSGLTSVTIPGSVTTIGDNAFGSTSVRELTFAYGTESVAFGEDAFPNLIKLFLDRPTEGMNLNVTNLKSLTIGNSVTKVSADKFKKASVLTQLALGSNLRTIGDNAFSGCTSLTEVILPPSVETIGASAFAGSNSLTSIIMGHSVKNIGEKAFDLCPAQTVSITAQTPPNAPDNTFSNYTGSLYVQGQAAAEAYYDADFCWYQFEGHVMIEPTEIRVEGDKNLNGKPGDTFQLTATLYPDNVTLPQIFWRSTNPAIATVDANGLVTLHADMSDVMAMVEGEDDTDARSCKIIAESLYADGPVAEFTINNTVTGIEDIIDDSTPSGDIDFSAPVQVFNLQGVMVSDSADNLAPGIYIIRQGNAVKKVAVK